jgi:hypothetical protein
MRKTLLALVLVLPLAACGDDDDGAPGDGDGDGGVAVGDPDASTPSPFAAKCTPEVEFENLSAAGNGAIFTAHVSDPTAFVQAQALAVCEVLYASPDDVPTRPRIKLVIEDMDGVAYTAGDEVHFSSQYMKDYQDNGGDIAYEITGVVVHEFTHVYQLNDGPGYFIEGMADFVRYRAGYVPIENRGPGGNWDDAYQTTGFFFDYLDRTYPEAGRELNLAMNPNDGTGWSNDVFVDLTTKDVDTLWTEYQASL